MTELATNTSTADRIIGSHSSDSSVIKPPQRLSGWLIVAADSLRVQPAPGTGECRTGEKWDSRGNPVAGLLRDETDRTRNARAAESAISARIFRQILLVVILGVVELRSRQDLGGDRAESRFLDVT